MRLPRWHGLEWEDLPLCPAVVRSEATRVLRRGYQICGWGRSLGPSLAPWLQRIGATRVIDCGSGGGGPWPDLLHQIPVQVHLTDRYPNLEAWTSLPRGFPGQLSWETQAVDARCLPPDLQGCWTFFNSFHHFRPEEAVKIVSEAVHRGQPIAVFEALNRHPSRLALVALMPLLALVTPAMIKPWSWPRFFFTYCLPLIPLLLLWDGCSSCFRIYEHEDWDPLIARADPNQSYHWEKGRLTTGWLPFSAPYVLGHPKRGES